MKKTLFILSFLLSTSVFAQSTASKSSSIASSASKQANSQTVVFTSPANASSKSVVEYAGDYKVKNVPSVSGPSLITSNDTCMGSTSGGANGAGFGISVGSTWTDEHCKRLKMSRELWNKGMKAASLAIDCMDSNVRDALEMTGTKCPQSMTLEERQDAFGAQASAAGAVASTRPLVIAPPPVLLDKPSKASATVAANTAKTDDASNGVYVNQFLSHK